MRTPLLAIALALAACAEPARPPPPAPPSASPAQGARGASPTAYEQHVLDLRRRLPRGFTVVPKPPFVVAGDEAKEVVQERAEQTVQWAVERLRRDFFDAEPRKILDVYLFKNAASYRDHTLALFGERPTTPYGYYSARHGALIMNIATGGGTLVHEIVHPFVEADFPGAPPWLNEGLGSLFEQSGDAGGHIVGYPNWRLPGLQEAIHARAVPSFEELFRADEHAFYDADPGTNYAQARYLCYYLQERGLLTRFYREFRAHRAEDPTGEATLRRVLGEPDLAAFKTRWEAFVAELHFP